jgi:uncharacterized protein (DUF488 family)
MRSLATIGYEQSGLADFIVALTAAGVKQLIDVREVPISRKRGFSKRVLSEALYAVGISYTHLRALGDPKPGREAARRGDQAKFLRIYHAHLATADATEALDEAEALAVTALSCLMCFERDYLDCHRNLIAKALADRGEFEIQHLKVAKAA